MKGGVEPCCLALEGDELFQFPYTYSSFKWFPPTHTVALEAMELGGGSTL